MTSAMVQAYHQVRGREALSVPLFSRVLTALLDVGEPARWGGRCPSGSDRRCDSGNPISQSRMCSVRLEMWQLRTWNSPPSPDQGYHNVTIGFVTLYGLLRKLTTHRFNSGSTSPNYPATDRTSLLLVKGIPGLEKPLRTEYINSMSIFQCLPRVRQRSV